MAVSGLNPSQIQLDIAKLKERNQARTFKFQDAALGQASAKLKMQKVMAEAQSGSNIDRESFKVSLSNAIQEHQAKSGDQGKGVVGSAIQPPGPAKLSDRPNSGGIDDIFSSLNSVVSNVDEGSPQPTGRQGEVSTTSTTTTQGGQGLKGTAGILAARAAGHLLDAIIPGKQEFRALKQAGKRVSTHTSTAITPEHRDLVQNTGTTMGSLAVDRERGDITEQEYNTSSQQIMGQLREPGDKKQAQQTAFLSAVIYRKELKTQDDNQARNLAATFGSQGILLSGQNLYEVATANTPSEIGVANGILVRAYEASPAGRRAAVQLSTAENQGLLTEAEVGLIPLRQKTAQAAYLRGQNELISSQISLNAALQRETFDGTNAELGLRQPPAGYDFQGTTAHFEGIATADPWGFGGPSANSLVNSGPFLTHSLYQMEQNNRPHYLVRGTLNSKNQFSGANVFLKTLDGDQLDHDLDNLQGNRRYDKDDQLVTNPGADWDEGVTARIQAESATRVNLLGFGIEFRQNEVDGSWERSELGGLMPELASKYLKRADLKNAREMKEGRIYVDSQAFNSRPGRGDSRLLPESRRVPAAFNQVALEGQVNARKKAKPGAFTPPAFLDTPPAPFSTNPITEAFAENEANRPAREAKQAANLKRAKELGF